MERQNFGLRTMLEISRWLIFLLLTAGEDLEDITPLVTLNSGAFSDLFPVFSGLDKQIRVKATDSGRLIFDSGPIELPDKSN